MKIVAVIGSRNPEGQTARAVNALLGGAEAASVEVERWFLPELKIERCRQCEQDGWGLCLAEGRCVIDDDLSDVVDAILSAEAIVFATAVYYSDLSESLRAFLDRFRRTVTHSDNQKKLGTKPCIGICVAGGGGGGAPSCAVSLEKVLQRCGLNLVDIVPVRRQNLAFKERLLALTGEWLVTQINPGAQSADAS